MSVATDGARSGYPLGSVRPALCQLGEPEGVGNERFLPHRLARWPLPNTTAPGALGNAPYGSYRRQTSGKRSV